MTCNCVCFATRVMSIIPCPLSDSFHYVMICMHSWVYSTWSNLQWRNEVPISQSRSTLRQSDWHNWDLAREPNHLWVLTKQANDSWHVYFASRTPPHRVGIKGEHVQTHIRFSLRSRAFLLMQSQKRVSTDSECVGVTAPQQRLPIQCCCFFFLDGVLTLIKLRSRCDLPWGFSTFFSKRKNLKELQEWCRHLFKAVLPLVCFWMWSLPGSI